MKKLIGIIGGSGVYDESALKNTEKIKIATPFGAPSAPITIGKMYGRDVAFLPRHGDGHTIPPHKVNYRANIWALKELGVERIISICAVGSLQKNFKPGQIVVCDQYIDFTKKREYSFFDGGQTVHISTADPFCTNMNELFIKASQSMGIDYHASGVYICIEGPRFSTRAESRMFVNYADIIGMTLVPEVQLAKEMELCYSSIAMITDYDVWAENPVDVKEVIDTMNKNQANVRLLLKEVIPEIPEKRVCECPDSLKNAII